MSYDRWSVLTWVAAVVLILAAAMGVAELPPVALHGPWHRLGAMDPLCGGTRSVRLAAMGHWFESYRYNPVGVPLVLGAGALLVRAAAGWISGQWIIVSVGWTTRRRRVGWVLLTLLLVMLDINQQAHTALLLASD